jgi:hypothetical protein
MDQPQVPRDIPPSKRLVQSQEVALDSKHRRRYGASSWRRDPDRFVISPLDALKFVMLGYFLDGKMLHQKK